MAIELPLLRQSERTSFRRCTQAWWWGYREGLTPRKIDSGAAWFGTGIHLVLAEWYIPGVKRGRDMLETWEEYTRGSYETIRVQPDFGEEEFANYEDARMLGEDMIRQYIEKYGTDDRWEVIAVEKRFSVLIPHPNRAVRRAIANNVGTFDLVIRDRATGRIYIVDHKTCKAFEYMHLTIDDQGGSYVSVGTHFLRQEGLIGEKEVVRGIQYNFLRKQKKDVRPENSQGEKLNKPEKKHYAKALSLDDVNWEGEDKTEAEYMKMTLAKLQEEAEDRELVVGGEVSKNQPQPNLYRHVVDRTTRERNRQITRIGTEVSIMNKFRSGKLPLYKNPTKDCTWQCDFFELCELDEKSGDVEDLKKMMYTTRDPYMDHREGAENSKTSAQANKEMRKKVLNGEKS